MIDPERETKLTVRIKAGELKKLKIFCLENDISLSDAVRSGLELMKICASYRNKKTDADSITIDMPREIIEQSKVLKEFLIEDNICFTPLTR